MRRKRMTALWPLFCLALLSACGSKAPETVTKVEYVKQEIPDVLLTCPEGPAVPDAAATQRTVAAFLVETVHAGEDCRAKLEAVGRLVRGEQ